MILRSLSKEELPMRTARLAPLVLLLLMTMNMTTAPAARADKSYRMPAVRITADLARDGSMQVREERTYRFKGRFKYAYRTYALDDRIDYEDFRVSENGRPYVQSDSEEPGTYKVTHGAEEVEVRWFYRARNETRTFAIDYGVRDAVHRHRDAAVLYYKFIGKGFKKRTDQVDITVNPPVAVEDWKVRQWAHGPLWGESRTSNDGVVTASCTKLPRRRFFELRILYPPELFPEAFERAGYVSASVTEEEAAWAEEANQERRRAVEKRDKLKKRQAVALRMVPVVVLLAWFWFVRLWRRQRRLFPGQGSIPVSTWSAPDDLPPALVSYLLNSRSVVASSLMATLMDLGRRGFVEFREEYVAKVGFLGREKWEPRHHWVLKTDHLEGHRAELLPFETELLDFVFEEMTGQRTDTVDSRAFRKKRSKVRSFFGRWSRMVKKEGASRAWFAEESIKARNRAGRAPDSPLQRLATAFAEREISARGSVSDGAVHECLLHLRRPVRSEQGALARPGQEGAGRRGQHVLVSPRGGEPRRRLRHVVLRGGVRGGVDHVQRHRRGRGRQRRRRWRSRRRRGRSGVNGPKRPFSVVNPRFRQTGSVRPVSQGGSR
ncbi:hypothetical protein CSA17_04500 [bacterium DOLJORAL78_65_58]|nr:MAG: hypothetical protein CSA17_04500 [bacterium DOLJORAL78_65_58]